LSFRRPIYLAICGRGCYISDIIAHSWALSGDWVVRARREATPDLRKKTVSKLNRAEATGRMSHSVIIKPKGD